MSILIHSSEIIRLSTFYSLVSMHNATLVADFGSKRGTINAKIQ